MTKTTTDKVQPRVTLTPVVALREMETGSKIKRLSFNLWKQGEVIPATNRVSMQVTAQERKKQALGNGATPPRFMLSPESITRLLWDTLIAVTTIFLAWRLPYSLVFELNEAPLAWTHAVEVFFDVVYIMDVIVNFRTGYRQDVEIILDPKSVAINYATSWFLIDLAASIPYELLFDSGSGVERVAVKTSIKYLKIPKLFRLARVIRFVRKHMEFMFTFQLILLFMSVVHWIACIWGSTSTMQDDIGTYGNITAFTRYGIYLYASTAIMLNMSPVLTIEPEHYIFGAMLSFFGFLMMVLVIASVTSIYIHHASRAVEYQRKIKTVMADLKALQVPKELRKSAKNYYDMLWRVKKSSDRYERAIYEDEDLSPTIRAEIALHIHRRAIALVPLFKGCTDDCLASVVMRLKTHLYMAKDVIFHRGEPGRSMLIIIRGKVKIIGPDNSVVAVLKEGSFFGEIGLLANTSRSCTVVAATFCELKSLEQKDAEVVFALYPHILDRLYRESDKRKRENRTRSSFCNIKVLDNAHVVDKCSIDEINGEFRTSPVSSPDHRNSLSNDFNRTSLLKAAERRSLRDIREGSMTEDGSTYSAPSPPAISGGFGHAVVKETLASLTSLHLDVERLKDTLQTVLDYQLQLMTKLNTMELQRSTYKRKDGAASKGPKSTADRSFKLRRQPSRETESLLSLHDGLTVLEAPDDHVRSIPSPFPRQSSWKDSTRSGRETSEDIKSDVNKSSDAS
ncbi:Voltage-gated Ion Channel (VIC) Superfamily [Thraustotheca clavata]|uniref:Voltage-gated Ion Channel (VIC) Superfamily n=1 Tax=Thraustotheca clavata TaxID=74557 RepID=A0A1V9YZ94_9STRA|nr:Voltage-gated Ion Channel (VIC) Superfamily [Thraustotheca clavata]